MARVCLAGVNGDSGLYREYLLRVFCWPNPAKYVFSFWGFIDLATILPLYVMWLWPEISLDYVFAWRAMRAFGYCVFSNSALCRRYGYSGGDTAHAISWFFYSFIAIVMIVFGALMY
jgi:voltage-gated potassium channel